MNPKTNSMLIKICKKLNLPRSLHEKAVESYQSVSKYLVSHINEDFKIYSQGSFATGTTVKPLSREEYDLDFVCETENIDPFVLFKIIKNALKINPIYKYSLEEKKRCIRINYANDYHLDILPAQSDKNSNSETSILIPDKEAQELISSDPKGYIKWFESFAHRIDTKEIETVPQYQSSDDKENIKLIVQLMKRHRDVYFSKQSDFSQNPDIIQSSPSIIITTLCRMSYKNENNILYAMKGITDCIIQQNICEVINPVNPKEVLSERWEKDLNLYNYFKKWIQSLCDDLRYLETVSENQLSHRLIEMFGDRIITSILEEQAREDKRKYLHKNIKNVTTSASGGLSLASKQQKHNPPHEFYGDDDNN